VVGDLVLSIVLGCLGGFWGGGPVWPPAAVVTGRSSAYLKNFGAFCAMVLSMVAVN
jgi:hypothetical protein